MGTLHLVAPDHRAVAKQIPAFDYDAQPVWDIRETLLAAYGQAYGPSEAIKKEEVFIVNDRGTAPVRALLYRPRSGEVRGAILHIHGGGWIAGSADMMASLCAGFADRHEVIVLSVDYRLAPEAPGDAGLDDCFAALEWLRDQAEPLGFTPERIAVLGDSAGANLSAGVALRARDAGTPILAQFLIYPAFDERTGGPDAPVDNPYAGEFVLTHQYIHQLWQARLTGVAPEKLPYLAPRRIYDLAGSPSTFLAVGSLDVLIDEALEYAGRLGRAGVPIELHVYNGVYHGFDLVPGATTDRFKRDLTESIESVFATAECFRIAGETK